MGWTDLSRSADGEYASVAYKGAREVWNLKTGKPVLVLKPNEPKPDTSSADSDQSDSPAESAGLQPTFSSDSRYFAGVDGDDFVVCGLSTGSVVFRKPGQYIRDFAFMGEAISIAAAKIKR